MPELVHSPTAAPPSSTGADAVMLLRMRTALTSLLRRMERQDVICLKWDRPEAMSDEQLCEFADRWAMLRPPTEGDIPF